MTAQCLRYYTKMFVEISHILSTPILADMLLREFNEELVLLVVAGFKDRFRGASAKLSEYEPPYEGTVIPEGLPFVAGSLITSTLSEEFGDRLASCAGSYVRMQIVNAIYARVGSNIGQNVKSCRVQPGSTLPQHLHSIWDVY